MTHHVEFDIEFKKNPHKGLFVVLEGIDGSGKTTQCNNLVEKLQQKGIDAICTKEPTDGEIGQLIRKVLSQEVKVPASSIQYLIAADRAVHQEEILQYLSQGKLVISDRYFWSAVAYGTADKTEVNFQNTAQVLMVSQSILSMYNQFILPDVSLYLDVSIDTALRRLSEMDKQKELYERKEKLERIAKGYEWLLQTFPQVFTKIDGEKSSEEISDTILNAIAAKK
jgi:dTMP kinase